MNRKLLFVAVTVLSFFSANFQLKAQADVTYSVDTLFNKPHGNKLMINLGAQADADANGAGSGYYGAYAHGRFNIGRFLQMGGTIAVPVTAAPTDKPDYKYFIMEAQGAFFFSDKKEMKSEKIVLTHSRKHAQGWNDKTAGNYEHSAQLPIQQSTQLGICGGIFTWTRPILRGVKDTVLFNALNTATNSSLYKDNVYTNVTVSGISAGFAVSTNTKAKYRFHIHKVEEGGNKKESKLNVRRNMSVDMGLELLYAPVILFQNSTTVMAKGGPEQYDISKLKTKHVGFRVRAEMRKKIFSLRFEMGMRPGVDYSLAGNSTKTYLNGAYCLLGMGIGLGAL
jgi:hypothetical protein